MKHLRPRRSGILPAIILVLTLAASVAILTRVLNQPEQQYRAVEFRNIDIGHLPATRERPKELAPRDEGLSSLDVIPKMSLPYSKSVQTPPEPPPVTPTVKKAPPPPAPAPPRRPAPKPKKQPLPVPKFKPITLKTRSKSGASSSAFLAAPKTAPKTKAAAPSGASAGPASSFPNRPRTFRDPVGHTTTRP